MDEGKTVEPSEEANAGRSEPSQDVEVVTLTERPSSSGPETIAIPSNLPLLPLRDAVAFPGTIMPLSVVREKSRRVLDAVLSGNKIIGIVAQRFTETEDPDLNSLYRIGTAAVILKLLRMPDNSQSIIIHGLVRFGIDSLTQTEPFLVAVVKVHEDHVDSSVELEALVHNCRHAADRLIELSPNVPEETKIVLDNIDRPGALADFLATNLSLSLAHKQEVLETFDVATRLRKVNAALATQLEVLELSRKLQGQVKEQIDKSQRQYFLQEQLKVIQKELGQTDQRTAEIEQFQKRIVEAKMPESVEQEAQRELDRLSKIPTASPEFSLAYDYLDWLCILPWALSTHDRLDIDRAERILDQDHHDLDKVKKRILQFLAVRKLKPHGRGPILCFVGPPGVGKTSLGQSIARALERKFIRISLGGIRDEADIRGHRRTYIGALPGRIIQEIRKVGSNNPVFMLDEVDKVGADFRGDPAAALLEVLDPEQNHSFTDHYLGVPFDLSRVMFIATANYTDPVAVALKDRMEVIELPGYTEQDKLQIARKYLVPRQLDEHGLTKKYLRFDDRALLKIISSYTREAGVRGLERRIAEGCRVVATQIARGRKRSVHITTNSLRRYLGPEKYQLETAGRTSIAGVATGLAFTPTGGEIIFIEAARMPGRGQLIMTGHIGNVMRESAQAAFSLLKSHADTWKVHADDMSKCDVHIHVPAGAIPKDGPSAGVAILTALVSLCKNHPVKSDVAMTGEITLRGLVLPVGGVKEKVLAAQRAGITTVILPERNKNDLLELPAEARKAVHFVLARNVDDVLRAALDSQPKRSKRKTAAKKRRKRPAGG